MHMTFVCVVYKLCMPSARGGLQRGWVPRKWINQKVARCPVALLYKSSNALSCQAAS